jgi:antitoxin FitA
VATTGPTGSTRCANTSRSFFKVVRASGRAKRHGRSMEEEIREILRDAAKKEVRSRKGLGTEIAALFRRSGLAAGEEIAEFHGTQIQPVDFAE